MEYANVLEKVTCWDKVCQIEFCDRISQQITIAIRVIWADERISSEEKVEAIKWINEFHHRVNNVRFDIKRNTDSASAIQALFAHAQDYAQENPHTRAGLLSSD
jgi:RNase H-fold protein (predicted Holliday junction resolvase)